MSEPAWPWVLEQIASSPVQVTVLPADSDDGQRCLAQLQVSDASALGAVCLNAGGLLIDDGWLRVLGGSVDAGVGLAPVNRFPATPDPGWRPEDGLVIGYDVLGGVFALNGHDPAASGRPGDPGQVVYFAPDTLDWDALPLSHSQWLASMLSGDITQFYDSLRWTGWQHETRALALTEGIAVYPFLWSQEAQTDLDATTRRPVPFSELISLTTNFTKKAGLPTPGFLGYF